MIGLIKSPIGGAGFKNSETEIYVKNKKELCNLVDNKESIDKDKATIIILLNSFSFIRKFDDTLNKIKELEDNGYNTLIVTNADTFALKIISKFEFITFFGYDNNFRAIYGPNNLKLDPEIKKRLCMENIRND